jgi:PD-(D/E)XK nuclease superfamily
MDERLALPEAHEDPDPLLPLDDSEGAARDPAPQSPFIEGTSIQWAWDSTCLGLFKTCPRKYQYKILLGWTRGTGIHLRWGQELHSALEDYDRSRTHGVRHDDAVHDVVRALLTRIQDWDPIPRTKSEELKTKDHLLRSVVWYLEHYNPDPAETVVLASGKPAVELSFRFELDFGPTEWWETRDSNGNLIDAERRPYSLCGHLDRVVSYSGDLFVMDRKTTTTTLGSYYFEKFDTDNQMSLYTLAGQILLKSLIRGVIIDGIQVAVGFSRFVRSFTFRTPDQLDDWLADTQRWLRYAEACAVEGFWPMNDTSCDKFGGCEFKGICSKSPAVRERFLEAEFRKEEPWNPLKPR